MCSRVIQCAGVRAGVCGCVCVWAWVAVLLHVQLLRYTYVCVVVLSGIDIHVCVCSVADVCTRVYVHDILVISLCVCVLQHGQYPFTRMPSVVQ